MKYAIRINNALVIGKHYEAIPISCINNTDGIMLFDFDEKDKAKAASDLFAGSLVGQPNMPQSMFDFLPINNLNISKI